jgi:hypothetical protein
MGAKHSPLACPLGRVKYCGVCACYGHSPRTCPEFTIREMRVPNYVEQLIAPSVLEEYGIMSATPLPGISRVPVATPQPVLHVLDDDKAIRAVLAANNLKPKGRVRDNRRLIEQLAQRDGMRLIFKKPVVAVE